jgi:menaquinone-9 beta-reductase
MKIQNGLRYDALIVGGGPAGATAAILLAQTGWRVAVAEKKPFPRRKVCGEFVSATSWPLLRELWVWRSLYWRRPGRHVSAATPASPALK